MSGDTMPDNLRACDVDYESREAAWDIARERLQRYNLYYGAEVGMVAQMLEDIAKELPREVDGFENPVRERLIDMVDELRDIARTGECS